MHWKSQKANWNAGEEIVIILPTILSDRLGIENGEFLPDFTMPVLPVAYILRKIYRGDYS